VKDLFIILTVLGLFIWGLVSIAEHASQEVDRKCAEQFGKEWDGKLGRGPDLCVNDEGEGKYLK
jgi:hypothetical protein